MAEIDDSTQPATLSPAEQRSLVAYPLPNQRQDRADHLTDPLEYASQIDLGQRCGKRLGFWNQELGQRLAQRLGNVFRKAL